MIADLKLFPYSYSYAKWICVCIMLVAMLKTEELYSLSNQAIFLRDSTPDQMIDTFPTPEEIAFIYILPNLTGKQKRQLVREAKWYLSSEDKRQGKYYVEEPREDLDIVMSGIVMGGILLFLLYTGIRTGICPDE